MAEVEPIVAPEGASVAFDVAVLRLSTQLKDIADLDTKIGVAIAALGVVVAAFVAQRLSAVLEGLFSAWLFVGLIQAIRAYLVGRYEVAPEPRPLAEKYSNQSADQMKWIALPAILDAIDANQPKLFQKGLRLNQVMITIGLVVGFALAAKAFGLA
jgi:hypothetical protein